MPLIDLNGLGHFKAKENAMVADAYSASKTYAVGDYVYYNGTLYRCTTAISTAEAWTAGHWTAAKLGDDCSALKTAITLNGFNLYDSRKATSGKYYNASGVETTKSSMAHSDFIAIAPSTEVFVSRGMGSSTYPTIVEFASDKTTVTSVETKGNTSAFSFTTNASTAFIVYNFAAAQIDAVSVALSTAEGISANPIGNGATDDCVLSSTKPIFYNNSALFSTADILLISKRGVFNFGQSVTVGNGNDLLFNTETQKLFASTDTADLANNKYLYVSRLKQCYSPLQPFAFWAAKVPPLTINSVAKTIQIYTRNDSYIYYNNGFITIPQIEPTTLTYSTSHVLLVYEVDTATFRTETNFNKIKNSDIIICDIYYGIVNAICGVIKMGQIPSITAPLYTYGDSLTWYNGQTYNRGIENGNECHGFQDYLSMYTGISLYSNKGSSGDTTPDIYGKIAASYSTIGETEPYITIMGGNNDDRLSTPIGTLQPYGSTFDTTTVYGALQASVELLATNIPKAHIVIMTEPMGWTYRNGGYERVDEDIAQAYRDVAEFYGLPLLDLWKNSGINEANRSVYMNDPETAHDYIYHPTNAGWERISRYICMEIGRC